MLSHYNISDKWHAHLKDNIIINVMIVYGSENDYMSYEYNITISQLSPMIVGDP